MYARDLDLKKALSKKSHFLLGPRATGKSKLIQMQLKNAQNFDLLNTQTYARLLRNPHSLSDEIRTDTVVIDEVQKLPVLLDEVHRLIEERGTRFLLTGSSARKLKHGGANLLAGRARTINLYPLTSRELGSDFNLERYCNVGGLPLVWTSGEPWEELQDYIQLYLKEEIISEAVVRKIDHYARFVDVMGSSSGEQLNYQKIATDSGVPVRTVANFVEVLKDTLLAFELEPLQVGRRRKVVAHSKLYLFDVGVANHLSGRKDILPKSEAFGKAFEHFIIQEIRACLSYLSIGATMSYWRTSNGNHEVDCLVGTEAAIEIKGSAQFSEPLLKGLRALKEEKKIKRFYLVSRDPVVRKVDGIEILPHDVFLQRLWDRDLGF